VRGSSGTGCGRGAQTQAAGTRIEGHRGRRRTRSAWLCGRFHQHGDSALWPVDLGRARVFEVFIARRGDDQRCGLSRAAAGRTISEARTRAETSSFARPDRFGVAQLGPRYVDLAAPTVLSLAPRSGNSRSRICGVDHRVRTVNVEMKNFGRSANQQQRPASELDGRTATSTRRLQRAQPHREPSGRVSPRKLVLFASIFGPDGAALDRSRQMRANIHHGNRYQRAGQTEWVFRFPHGSGAGSTRRQA